MGDWVQDDNEEEDGEAEDAAAEVENALAVTSPMKTGGKAAARKAAKAAKAPARTVTWTGASSSGANGAKMYK